jgi:hypothetical protein
MHYFLINMNTRDFIEFINIYLNENIEKLKIKQ